MVEITPKFECWNLNTELLAFNEFCQITMENETQAQLLSYRLFDTTASVWC